MVKDSLSRGSQAEGAVLVRAFVIGFLLLSAVTLLMFDYQSGAVVVKSPEITISGGYTDAVEHSPSRQSIAHPFGKSGVSDNRRVSASSWREEDTTYLERPQLVSTAEDSSAQQDRVSMPVARNDIPLDTGRVTDAPQEVEKDPQAIAAAGIFGWVQNEFADPLAGIQISTRLQRALPGDAAAAEGETAQTTYTDSEGQFRFDRLPAGEYFVRAHAQGAGADATSTVRTGTGAVVLQLSGQVPAVDLYLYGAVTSTEGLPLEGVRVVPVGHKTMHNFFTDASGYYGFNLAVRRNSPYPSLRFMLQGFYDQQLSTGHGGVGEGNTSVQLDARLEPIGSVTSVNGNVRAADGEAVLGAIVELYAAERGRSYRGVSDAGGRFLIPDVEIDTHYRIRVHAKGGYRDYVQEGFYIGSGHNELSIRLEALQFVDFKGQMRDVDGNPVPRLTLWLRSSQPMEQPYLAVTGDSEGYFSAAGLPEGEVTLMTQSQPRLTVSGIRLAADASNTVEVIVDDGELVSRGQVTAPEGTPVAGARVTLLWLHSAQGLRSSSRRTTLTDREGNFTFSRLGPGPHTLIIEAAGFQTARLIAEAEAPTRGGALPVELKSL